MLALLSAPQHLLTLLSHLKLLIQLALLIALLYAVGAFIHSELEPEERTQLTSAVRLVLRVTWKGLRRTVAHLREHIPFIQQLVVEVITCDLETLPPEDPPPDNGWWAGWGRT